MAYAPIFKILDNGVYRDMTEQEMLDYQEGIQVVPRKWLKALLQALINKGVFTAQEVQTFLNNNRS